MENESIIFGGGATNFTHSLLNLCKITSLFAQKIYFFTCCPNWAQVHCYSLHKITFWENTQLGRKYTPLYKNGIKKTQIKSMETTVFGNQPPVFYLAIRQRSEDPKHLIPRPGMPGIQGQHAFASFQLKKNLKQGNAHLALKTEKGEDQID